MFKKLNIMGKKEEKKSDIKKIVEETPKVETKAPVVEKVEEKAPVVEKVEKVEKKAPVVKKIDVSKLSKQQLRMFRRIGKIA